MSQDCNLHTEDKGKQPALGGYYFAPAEIAINPHAKHYVIEVNLVYFTFPWLKVTERGPKEPFHEQN